VLGTDKPITLVQALTGAILAQSSMAHIAVVDSRLVAIRQACQIEYVQDGVVVIERFVHVALDGWCWCWFGLAA
jgi:hypothetical protein